jgi:hypothetical protein
LEKLSEISKHNRCEESEATDEERASPVLNYKGGLEDENFELINHDDALPVFALKPFQEAEGEE